MSLKEIYQELQTYTSLKPSPRITELFTQLVTLSLQYDRKIPFPPSKQEKLQVMCSCAEYELEKYWADTLIASEKPHDVLTSFPYYKNYVDLTRLEWKSFQGCAHHHDHKILFIGGGPLPLTSIVLAEKHNISSTILDSDLHAVIQARRVIKKLGLEDKISVIRSAGETFDGFSNFNVIFVAALAGIDATVKEDIFKTIKKECPEKSHVIARSAWNNRKLLYKPLSKQVFSILKPEIRVDTYNEIVNSFIIFKT